MSVEVSEDAMGEGDGVVELGFPLRARGLQLFAGPACRANGVDQAGGDDERCAEAVGIHCWWVLGGCWVARIGIEGDHFGIIGE